MRFYLNLLEHYITTDVEPQPVVEEAPQINVHDRLADIVFKLRSHVDPTGGDYSLGFESGLEMAAAMIENVLKATAR